MKQPSKHSKGVLLLLTVALGGRMKGQKESNNVVEEKKEAPVNTIYMKYGQYPAGTFCLSGQSVCVWGENYPSWGIHTKSCWLHAFTWKIKGDGRLYDRAIYTHTHTQTSICTYVHIHTQLIVLRGSSSPLSPALCCHVHCFGHHYGSYTVSSHMPLLHQYL